MTNEEIMNLGLSLLQSDTVEQVIENLKAAGFWDDAKSWRYYGDREDNFSIVGNQQSRPEAALVEKIVNSVDAVLMNECWLRGMPPESDSAPKSIYEAVALYLWVMRIRLRRSVELRIGGMIRGWRYPN